MKKLLTLLVMLALAGILSAQKPYQFPAVDYKVAQENRQPVKMSDIVKSIEYLNLNWPSGFADCSTSYSDGPRILVGNQVILLSLYNLERIFVYDRSGKFLHAFDDLITIGKSYAKLTTVGGPWDLSPDEKSVVTLNRGSLHLYDIKGNLKKSGSVPWKGSKIFFLDNKQIVLMKSRRAMKKDGCLIYIFNSNLEITDSLFPDRLAGLNPDKSNLMANLPEDGFYKLNNKICIWPADQDTLFQIKPDHSLNPVFSLDLKEFKVPYVWRLDSKDRSKFTRVTSLMETENYFILELVGPMRKDGDEEIYETLMIDKKSGTYFTTKRATNNPEQNDYYTGIPNDLDGLYVPTSFFVNDKCTEILRNRTIKSILETNGSKDSGKNPEYMKRLRNTLASAQPNSMTYRIVRFLNPGVSPKITRLNSKNPYSTRLNPVVPVRTNHQWDNAEMLSDITYDPTDDSFWLVKMSRMDTIEHRNRKGELIPGTFVIQNPTGIEGITVSASDSTLWLADGSNFGYLHHYDRYGKDLGNGFQTDSTGIFGIAWDQTDNTLWISVGNKSLLQHYTTSGKKLADVIDFATVGCEEVRGLAYDIRDNSLWLLNSSPHKIVHITKSGKVLPGSFYFNPCLGLPDGLALDFKGFEFWVGDWAKSIW